jgi:phosphatidylserine decarboxylase
MSGIVVAALVVGGTLQFAASRKWCFRAGIAVRLIVIAFALGLVAAYTGGALGWHGLLTGVVTFGVQMAAFIGQIAFLFYRDPERTPPADPDALLSPADGEVIYVRRIAPSAAIESTKNGCNLLLTELADTDLARKELWQIGISMQFTDVHVNRSPIAGVVTKLVHTPGKFLSLRLEVAAKENERQTILIAGGLATVAVVQIASRLVRQIVAYVNASESIAKGQRIGIIRFGSQVDVLVPVEDVAEITAREGESIRAGVTIIGRLARGS